MKHNFEISYTQQGDYLLPDLRLPKQPTVEIGIWGKRHLRYRVSPKFCVNSKSRCKIEQKILFRGLSPLSTL